MMDSMRLAALICVFGVALASSEFSHENVETLTAANFDEKVSDGRLYFIKFYAPWCGHCKKLVPTWGELGKAYKDNDKVVIAHVDCTVHKAICEKAEVKGYPTLKVYFDGQMHKRHQGGRDIDALKKTVDESFGDLFTETKN